MALSKKDKAAVTEAVDGFMDFYRAYSRMVQLGHDHPENVWDRARFGEHYPDWLAEKAKEYRDKLAALGIDLDRYQIHQPN